MAVNIPQLSATKLYNYHYDQLNRIVAMDMYNGLSPTAGTFTPVSDTSYKERVSYDPNGNILGYLRNGDAGNTMDSLNYKYYASTNKLSQVTDNVSATKYTTDIDNQAANNYTYDAIGNMISDAGDSIYSTSPITWNVYGKILSVTKNGRVVRYVYDAGGNRIMKYTNADTTVYVRDATGNVLSVYSKPANNSSIVQTEMHLYGSSRLGMATQHLAADTGFNLSNGFGSITGRIFTRGEKFFELSNHLGNVLATVSDRRIQVDANSDGTVDSYKADLVSANDYYPFGMLMPGRKYSIVNTNYRYGFNGKENDNETSTEDYGMRIYDGRLGRFLSVDPLFRRYSWLTPYQFASNKPVWAIDIDGNEGGIRSPLGDENIISVESASRINPKISQYAQSASNSFVGDVKSLGKSKTYVDALDFFSLMFLPDVGSHMDENDQKRYNVVENEINTIKNIPNWGPKEWGSATGHLAFQILLGKALKFAGGLGRAITGTWVAENTAGWSESAIAYQEYVTGARSGSAFEVNGVKFDGIRKNTLLEAKSSYDNFVNKKTGEFYSWFRGKNSLVDQAQRQIKGADGASIEWNFSSQKSLDATQKLFKENNITGITLKYTPKK